MSFSLHLLLQAHQGENSLPSLSGLGLAILLSLVLLNRRGVPQCLGLRSGGGWTGWRETHEN